MSKYYGEPEYWPGSARTTQNTGQPSPSDPNDPFRPQRAFRGAYTNKSDCRFGISTKFLLGMGLPDMCSISDRKYRFGRPDRAVKPGWSLFWHVNTLSQYIYWKILPDTNCRFWIYNHICAAAKNHELRVRTLTVGSECDSVFRVGRTELNWCSNYPYCVDPEYPNLVQGWSSEPSYEYFTKLVAEFSFFFWKSANDDSCFFVLFFLARHLKLTLPWSRSKRACTRKYCSNSVWNAVTKRTLEQRPGLSKVRTTEKSVERNTSETAKCR